MAGGRPTKYTKALGEDICFHLMMSETLRQISRDESMPDKATIMRWVIKHEEFRDLYVKALEMRMHFWADDIVEIADDGSNDWMEKELEGGHIIEVENKEVIARSRLRVDVRKWLMVKLAPRTYGERLEVDNKGKVTTEHVHIYVPDNKRGG